jgi:hypothetical protein
MICQEYSPSFNSTLKVPWDPKWVILWFMQPIEEQLLFLRNWPQWMNYCFHQFLYNNYQANSNHVCISKLLFFFNSLQILSFYVLWGAPIFSSLANIAHRYLSHRIKKIKILLLIESWVLLICNTWYDLQ